MKYRLLVEAAEAFAAKLRAEQIDLPADAAKMLRDHFWELIDTSDHPPLTLEAASLAVPVAQPKTLAQVYYDAYFAQSNAEEALDDALLRAFGVDPRDVDSWPCGHMVYDWYDCSFELRGTRDDYAIPEDLSAVWALGFMQGWICFVDGTEIFVSAKGKRGDRKPSHSGGRSERKRERRLPEVGAPLVPRRPQTEKEEKDVARVDRDTQAPTARI